MSLSVAAYNRPMRAQLLVLVVAMMGWSGGVGAQVVPERELFVSMLAPDSLEAQQAVIETAGGTIVLDLLNEVAPNHVAHFITTARAGAYDGTIFHRIVSLGIIQGGDPLSTDPAQAERYGTGGLGVLRFEPNDERHTRGAVSAVRVPGDLDSAGSQFFICISDQPALDGEYTVFARVVEGLDVAQELSTRVADANGVPAERLDIVRVTIRNRPEPEPEPFADISDSGLGAYHARLETSLGPIVFAFRPDLAPNHVRNFLRLADLGVFDGTAFHRVVPGFVIQGGFLPTRLAPLDVRQEGFVSSMAPEFSAERHVRGTLSMAHGDDPASATTSFFIVTEDSPTLDGQYTVFGHVVEGFEVFDRIEAVALDGEAPATRIDLASVAVVSAPPSAP
jgi:peptidyl-prolyl cis-trans isomerase B (cyclophilin B)